MKVLLCSIGSRGDMEPFMSIAEVLHKNGWEVICAFPEQFREMAEDEGYQFFGFTKEFIEVLMKSTEGNMLSGGEGNFFQRMNGVRKLIKMSLNINRQMADQQHEITLNEKPDLVFFHPKCIYFYSWGLKYPNRAIVISPLPCIIHPISSHSIIGLKGGGNYGPVLNRLSYWLSNTVRAYVFASSTKKYGKHLADVKINSKRIKRSFLNELQTWYSISPTLFPRPSNWPPNAQVIGYPERDKIKDWIPSAGLLEFISFYKKIVFISFGSISNPNPELKTQYILDALDKHKTPAIINTSWGGLIKPSHFPDHVHFVQNIPYDWVFPQVHAVIHHGGSGTTHSALKYGCASLIIPHFIDQFFWNQRVFELGAGPLGVSIKKLNQENFETLLIDLLNNQNYKRKAEALEQTIHQEFDENTFMDLIQQTINPKT